jgi:hypothetical protein
MGLGGSCPDKELEAAAEARGTRPTPTEVIDRLLARRPVPGLTVEDLVTHRPNGIGRSPWSTPSAPVASECPTAGGTRAAHGGAPTPSAAPTTNSSTPTTSKPSPALSVLNGMPVRMQEVDA